MCAREFASERWQKEGGLARRRYADYEALHWTDIEALLAALVKVSGMTLASRRSLGRIRRHERTEVVFRN